MILCIYLRLISICWQECMQRLYVRNSTELLAPGMDIAEQICKPAMSAVTCSQKDDNVQMGQLLFSHDHHSMVNGGILAIRKTHLSSTMDFWTRYPNSSSRPRHAQTPLLGVASTSSRPMASTSRRPSSSTGVDMRSPSSVLCIWQNRPRGRHGHPSWRT